MSHFTLLVVGNENRLEDVMAPFDEQTEDPRFRKFDDQTDEHRKEYETKSTEKVIAPDGTKLWPWDDRLKNPERDDNDFLSDKPRNIVPEGYKKVKIPFKELYPTFEEFMADWADMEPNEEGRYGYFRNPNAKWDWYQIGGRWAGFFRIKESARSKYEGSEPNFSYGWDAEAKEEVLNGNVLRVDQARVGDIDFEAPRNEAEERARKTYSIFEPIVKDFPLVETWESFRQKVEDKEIASYDVARNLYHDQPRIKAVDEFRQTYRNDDTLLGKSIFWFDDVEGLNLSIDEYVKQAREKAVSTFAVLKDGKWFERGNMGWWACVSNEKDQETWNSIFTNVISGLSEDTVLTLIDCHI